MSGSNETPPPHPVQILSSRRPETIVVHVNKRRYDVYIGRPSVWGNPFVIGKDGAREEVVQKYREWIMTQPHLLARIKELKGKILGCWCSPLPCHGDVLAELANEGTEPRAVDE